MKAATMKIDPVAVGERLRARRKEVKLNQTDLAEVLGVSQSTVSDYEKGRLELSLDQACLLVERLRISFEWLCYGDRTG